VTAPALITELGPGEVFVFGSNAKGLHVGGAARFAVERFGAVLGQGEGLQGASYAIPTMEGPVDFTNAVARFLGFASLAPGIRFLLTPIGTGIAGHPVSWVAPLFRRVPANVELPAVFEAVLA
jgi:hypothetical protein